MPITSDKDKHSVKKAPVDSSVESLYSRLEDLEKKSEKAIKKEQKHFARRFPMLYAFCAFVGLLFCWYGFWTIISATPIIGNPYVSSAIGIIILLVLGQFYNNMI